MGKQVARQTDGMTDRHSCKVVSGLQPQPTVMQHLGINHMWVMDCGVRLGADEAVAPGCKPLWRQPSNAAPLQQRK